MRANFVKTLLVILVAQSIVLGYVAIEYRWFQRAEMMTTQGRFGFGKNSYKRNVYYRQYKEIFSEYKLTGDSIMFVGDSIVATPDWNLLLGVQSPRFINQGIPGDILSGLSERLDLVLEASPIGIIIWGGVNDMLSFHPLESLLLILEKIKNKLAFYGGETLILSVSPVSNGWKDYQIINSSIKLLNNELKILSVQSGWDYIDTWQVLADEDGNLNREFTVDGVHLNAKGYKEIAASLSSWLRRDPCLLAR